MSDDVVKSEGHVIDVDNTRLGAPQERAALDENQMIDNNNSTSIQSSPFAIYHQDGYKFTGGYELFLRSLLSLVEPYVIHRIIKGHNAHKNMNPTTSELYPYWRCQLLCGSCKARDRDSLCQLRLLLHDNDDGEEPYLEVREFCFPKTSMHRITTHKQIKGLEIINNTFTQLGLEMHIGSDRKKSKTEAMYFPTGSFFNRPTESMPALSFIPTFNPADDTVNEENYPAVTTASNRKQTFSRMTQKQRQDIYFASDQTNRIYLSNGTSYVDFTAHFKYLGTYISFDLTEDFDINNRITKASREMGRLGHFFQNQYIELKFKHQVFTQYIINILLWGCENWAIKEHHFLKLNSFIHRSIRSILRIKMTQVRDEHIKNTRIRKIFFNLPNAQNLVAIRSMTYIGKVLRSPDHCPTKQLLTAFSNNPRPQSGVIMTNKKAIVNSLHLLLPDIMEETITASPTSWRKLSLSQTRQQKKQPPREY